MDVYLRPLEERDAHTSWRWRNIPEIWSQTGSAPDREITLQDEIDWIRKVLADRTCQRYAIVADGAYVGNMYLTGIENGAAEYHVFIGERAMWGKGIARKASERLIALARDGLGLKQISLNVRPSNVRAIALYESLGFIGDECRDELIRMELVL